MDELYSQTERRPRRRHTLLKVIIALLVLAIAAYVFVMWRSVVRLSTLLASAEESYQSAMACVEDSDYDGAMARARDAAASVGSIRDELAGTQWDIAAAIPVVGDDVDIARQMAGIADTLMDDALIPVLDGWDNLSQSGIVGEDGFDLARIGEAITQVHDLSSALITASAVVDECRAQADALPTSHFEQLNEAAAELQGAIASADEQLDGMADTIELVDSVTSGIMGLFGL